MPFFTCYLRIDTCHFSHVSLRTPFFGPIIRVLALWSPPQHFCTTSIRFLGTKPCGTGCGLYLTPKRFKCSSGRLCRTIFPPKHSLHLVTSMWTHSVPAANLLKQPFTFYKTALGQEKSGINFWEYCPCPSLVCLCKTSCDIMQHWRGLFYPISSHGKSFSLSLAGNFG